MIHAGDGNQHPFVVFDWRDRKRKTRVAKGGAEILQCRVEMSDTLSETQCQLEAANDPAIRR